MKMQAEMEMGKAKMEMEGQFKSTELQQRQQLDGAKLSLEAQVKQAEIEVKRAELDLKREELALKKETAQIDAALKIAAAGRPETGPDGKPLANGSAELGGFVSSFLAQRQTDDDMRERQSAALTQAIQTLAGIAAELAKPKSRRISTVLPSGQPFNAMVTEQ